MLRIILPLKCNYLQLCFRSGIGTIFALPWLLSWFSHSLNQHMKVVRLFDYFLASPKDIILYVIAQLINARSDEVLKVDCDMASVHSVLSKVFNIKFSTQNTCLIIIIVFIFFLYPYIVLDSRKSRFWSDTVQGYRNVQRISSVFNQRWSWH